MNQRRADFLPSRLTGLFGESCRKIGEQQRISVRNTSIHVVIAKVAERRNKDGVTMGGIRSVVIVLEWMRCTSVDVGSDSWCRYNVYKVRIKV